MVTTFSKAGLCFPDQYLKLKSSSVSQPSLLLYDFVTQTCAAAGSSHTAGSEVSHSADKIAQKQSRDCTFWLNESLIILMTSLRKQFYPNYHQGFCSSKAHGSTKSQTWYWLLFSSHSIWAKSDLFPTKLAHFSPKGTAGSLRTTRKPCWNPFFSSHCNGLVSGGGTCPKVRGQERWALPLPLMWVSSVQRRQGNKGAQRLPEGDSSLISALYRKSEARCFTWQIKSEK